MGESLKGRLQSGGLLDAFEHAAAVAPLVGLEYTMVLPPSSRRQARLHRSLAFRWVRANGEHKKEATPNGVASFLAPLVGLEPTTCGLTVRRSTD